MGESHAWEAGAEEWVHLARGEADAARLAHDESVGALLPPPAGLTLDVGCGEGRWTRVLRERGYDVVGIDRSESLLDAARGADPEGRYERGDAEALPVGDAEATLVLCVNVLPHVVDLDAAVAELVRVLAPSGVVVIGLIHPIAEAGTLDDESGELRVRDYFVADEHAIPLGHGHVFHQHRTIEQYLRPFLAAGLVLDGLREIPHGDASVPRFLDARFRRL